MAEELPEIVPMPDELGPSLSGLRRNAEWSHQFAPSDTSLAQRARGNADKIRYEKARQEHRRTVEMEELKTNKDAQDLYFRNKKLEMDRTGAEAALRERAQRMRFQAELHPEILRNREAQTAASLALEKQRASAELRHTKEELRKSTAATQENQFFADREDFLFNNPGATPEQIEEADIARGARFPHARNGKEAAALLTMAERNAQARKQEALRAGRLSPSEPQYNADGTVRVGTAMYRYNDKGDLVKIGVEGPGGPGVEDGPTIRETVKSGDASITTTRKVTTGEVDKMKREALLKQHAELEGALNATAGKTKPDPSALAKINAVKAQLGFAQLDANGQAMGAPAPTATAPAASGLKPLAADVAAAARAAIAAGKDAAAVRKRLEENGYDSSGP